MADDGGPAFPFGYEDKDGEPTWSGSGMSLRDYFAAAAMPVIATAMATNPDIGPISPRDFIATMAYSIADAMLKERAK